MESGSNQSVPEKKATAVELIELFYERIYGFLRRLTSNDADAADLTQKTFSRVWQNLSSFEGRSSPGAWIHRIAYNVYVDWRRSFRPTETRSDEWWTGYPGAEPQPDELAAKQDLQATVFQAVDSLEPELRDTIHLHYYQELTLQETAEAMGVALSTVKYRQNQAVTQLQKKLSSSAKSLNPIFPSE